MPTSGSTDAKLERARKAVIPIFSDQGFNWERHVDEMPSRIWPMQGVAPPNSGHKKRHAEKPTSYTMDRILIPHGQRGTFHGSGQA